MPASREINENSVPVFGWINYGVKTSQNQNKIPSEPKIRMWNPQPQL
jgi:hypothetical protein